MGNEERTQKEINDSFVSLFREIQAITKRVIDLEQKLKVHETDLETAHKI